MAIRNSFISNAPQVVDVRIKHGSWRALQSNFLERAAHIKNTGNQTQK